jgi:hypothetical protein
MSLWLWQKGIAPKLLEFRALFCFRHLCFTAAAPLLLRLVVFVFLLFLLLRKKRKKNSV